MKIYTIKDTKLGYMQPFIQQNNAVAIRAFTNGANEREPNTINTNPEDKELWYLGEYDQDTGVIQGNPQFLEKAINVIKRGE